MWKKPPGSWRVAKSEDPDALHRLGNLYDKQGLNEKATPNYLEAIQRGKDTPEIHCDLGYNYYLRRRFDEAERHLTLALSLRPDFPRAHNNLGMLLAQTGRRDKSLSYFARAGLSESDARLNIAVALLTAEQGADAAAVELHAAIAADRSGKSADRIRRLESRHPTIADGRSGDENEPCSPVGSAKSRPAGRT